MADIDQLLDELYEAVLDGKRPSAVQRVQQLIDAGVISGRSVTSYYTLQTDLKNAGANWSDQEVVVDQGLVTSRNPHDLPAFNDKLLEEIAEGEHAGQTA